MRDAGCASATADLRKGKSVAEQQLRSREQQRGVKSVREHPGNHLGQWSRCRADLPTQPWKSPWCSSGWSLQDTTDYGEPLQDTLGWRCSLWSAVCSGVRGLELLPSVGTHVEQCLKGRPHGMELCWSSAGRAAAFGKPTQDVIRNDSIPWEGPHAAAGAERHHEEQQRWTDHCSCSSLL